jgi:phosphonate transport system ATP-binding protein
MAHRVLELLCRLAEQDGVALLCTLHQPDLAAQYFPRVMEMRRGQIVSDSATAAEEERLHLAWPESAEPRALRA